MWDMALYDTIGTRYDSTRRPDSGIVSLLLELLAPHPGRLYLDLACGTGNYTRALSKRGVEMIGIDVSRRMIQRASQKDPEGRWVHYHNC